MRPYYEPVEIHDKRAKGKIYHCDHPICNSCTLYLLPDGRGLGIVQMRFNKNLKVTWWGTIDTSLNIDISQREGLEDYLNEKATLPKDGLYPIVSVRKVMWALHMPPMRLQPWEIRV